MRFPRVRGDVPIFSLDADRGTAFSPRARGCSGSRGFVVSAAAVFPACAGMFLTLNDLKQWLAGFPRVRGDVPPRVLFVRAAAEFSPRARGCSSMSSMSLSRNYVFPACAGMFQGVPVRCDSKLEFSPRARGCSSSMGTRSAAMIVFPACAGMFHTGGYHSSVGGGFPRVRGDVPQINQSTGFPYAFSPRARGCSYSMVAVAQT